MRKINETAAAGSTSAGSIAVVPSNRLGGMQTRISLKKFMSDFHSRVGNRYDFKPVNASIKTITESSRHPYQQQNVTSKLKSLQMDGQHKENDVITYGIEDDAGVMMKITIPLQQGEDFERTVAQSLAAVLDFKKTGKGEDKTLAELLYELKDEFTILDAQFPTIPKDAVYNADAISEDLPDEALSDSGEEADIGDESDIGDDLDMDDDADKDETNLKDGDDEEDEDDVDIGDNFDDSGDTDDSKESLLKAVLGMLQSQAERDIAKANERAERAKAKQAALALKSSKSELAKQEKLMAAEAEMDAEKEREKRAKEMAELAKFNIRKKKGMTEGFSPLFRQTLLELDANDTPQGLRRQLSIVNQKYKPEPDDSPETQKFKREQGQLAMRELRIKMRAAQNRQGYEANKAEQERRDRQNNQDGEGDQPGQQPQQQGQQTQQPSQQAQQPSQPVGTVQ